MVFEKTTRAGAKGLLWPASRATEFLEPAAQRGSDVGIHVELRTIFNCIGLKMAEKSCKKKVTPQHRTISILVNQPFVMVRCAVAAKCEPAIKFWIDPR